ncbi:MAG: hypothetical protein KF754_01510 [Planctomycetes bacterium]|nr:hypothetical protein [Planctomycetota bacterium]
MKTLLLLLLTALLLSACGSQLVPTNNGHSHSRAHNYAKSDGGAGDNAHAGHANDGPAAPDEGGHGGHTKITFNWDDLKPPVPAGDPVDLKNELDPVTRKPVTEPGKVTVLYKGYRVHFASEATRERFNKKSLKYLNTLSLEPQVDGSVKLVDASNWVDCVTETCPLMEGSEVDPHGTVYLLHRGFKIFFCCWTGCGDGFMQEPAKYYDWYGLVEKDGRLQLK